MVECMQTMMIMNVMCMLKNVTCMFHHHQVRQMYANNDYYDENMHRITNIMCM